MTIIGAVSPQGSDFSEPVTQNTKRFVRAFWALDKALAYARHYPAINWTTSYSEYIDELKGFYDKNYGEEFLSCRQRVSNILSEEAKLMEIVKLIGADVLPEDQKLTITAAKLVRVGFLQQNAFHADDTYVPLEKQLGMMKVILYFYDAAMKKVKDGVPVSQIAKTGLEDAIVKIKYNVPNNELQKLDEYYPMIDEKLAEVK